MRRSTTSVGTEASAGTRASAVTDTRARNRARLAALLIAELLCAVLLLDRGGATPDRGPGTTEAAPAALTTPTATTRAQTLSDGRTVHYAGLGGQRAEHLIARVAAEMDGAAAAVTAFWGPDWPRAVTIVVAGTDAQFAAVGGGDAATAATTTDDRIMFAPGAADMSPQALRIVLRHELFHYAARARTAADAPRWLTEGMADFVGRPAAPPPAGTALSLPTDADLSGPDRSSAYDRAWWFTRFVADRYGVGALRELYLAACAPGHPDVATAIRDTLGAGQATVLAQWRQWAGN
ncbi:peptidase [Mycolicibacterium flavescens]|uniref:Peptidase n=1 Tax=Mycolicibacterium flavescens TaxID=1776 RepID=A0A1E3RMD1_MYCFV|nr:peptidase [Mycolicibacterium flavescens]MCV7281489.1 peptidase [Mycolicibacterium flavescens]ODQ91014.1 peptidase [Mycolicibacterium flavescens]